MAQWFDVLLRPRRFTHQAQTGQFSPQGATSILLDGFLSWYLHLAEKAPWPSIDEPDIDPQYALPAALLSQLSGSGTPDAFAVIASDLKRGFDERVLAAALGSAFFADLGQTDRALGILVAAADDATLDELGRLFIRTHHVVRLIEAGEWQEALELSNATSNALRRYATTGGGMRPVLTDINAVNQEVIRQVGFGKIAAVIGRNRHLQRVNELTASGLETDADLRFDERFASVLVSTIRFRNEDRAERALWGALLRSETWGDFQATNRARRNLGKYLLSTSAGQQERDPVAGLTMLLRGGDANALVMATDICLARGPLAAVGTLGKTVAESMWRPLVVVPSIRFLTRAADVLDDNVLELLAHRLCSEFQALKNPTALSRSEPDLLQAMAAVVRAARPETQAIVASYVLSLVNETRDALTLQSVSHVIRAVEWSAQQNPLVDEWIQLIRRSLGARTDVSVAAETALFELLDVRADELLNIVRETQPMSPLLAAAALYAGSPHLLTQEEVSAAAGRLAQTLAAIREAANARRFSMGRNLDAGAILARLLLHYDAAHPYWPELVDYITDPNVSALDKQGPVEVLSRDIGSIPTMQRQILKTRFGGMRGVAEPFNADPEFEGCVLRIGLGVGAMSDQSALEVLLGLAAANVSRRRLEAAHAGGMLPPINDPAVLAVLLVLSRDFDFTIRSAACRSLASRRWPEEYENGLVWPRLTELLSEGGRGPIAGVLIGLRQRAGGHHHLPRQIISRVMRMADDHQSSMIRTLAQQVSARLREEGIKPSD
jgi:hypothetical protein